jgi:hypothetical protein
VADTPTGGGSRPEPEEEPEAFPRGIVAGADGEGYRAARERLRAEVAELADEAESRAWEEFESAVLDATEPGPRPIDAARLAAGDQAVLLAAHGWMSLPIQGEEAGQVGFLVGESDDDESGALISLPLADVYVNVETLSTTVDRLAAEAAPMFAFSSEQSRALPAAQSMALWSELNDLADRLATDRRPATSDLDRFDLLLRFMVPEELFPHYVRLNPPFFERLAGASGRGPLAPGQDTPTVDSDYLPPDPAFFDLLDAESLWDFDCASLGQAARDAGLEVLEQSVLPGSWGDISEAFEAVTGVAPLAWLNDLVALAEPGWQVRVRGISENGKIAATYSVARKPPHAWVCTRDGRPGCQVVVGAGPDSAYRLAVSALMELGADGASDRFVELPAGEVARLFAGLREGATFVAEAAGGVPWPEPSGQAPADGDPPPAPELEAAAAALPTARAAVCVTSTDYSQAGAATTGLVAMATPQGCWLVVPVHPWTNAVAADAPVFLYTASHNLVRATIAKLVGMTDPPPLEGGL